mgnify:FL=1
MIPGAHSIPKNIVLVSAFSLSIIIAESPMWHHESIVVEYSLQKAAPSANTSEYVFQIPIYACSTTALTNDFISSKTYCLALYLSETAFCKPYIAEISFDSSVNKYSVVIVPITL